MCDRCSDIRTLVEAKIREVVDHFQAMGDTKEHHMAQILRDDPAAEREGVPQRRASPVPVCDPVLDVVHQKDLARFPILAVGAEAFQDRGVKAGVHGALASGRCT